MDKHIKSKEKVAPALIAYALTYRKVGTTQEDSKKLVLMLYVLRFDRMHDCKHHVYFNFLPNVVACEMLLQLDVSCAITLKWLTQGHGIPVPPKHWFALTTDKTLNTAYWDTSI